MSEPAKYKLRLTKSILSEIRNKVDTTKMILLKLREYKLDQTKIILPKQIVQSKLETKQHTLSEPAIEAAIKDNNIEAARANENNKDRRVQGGHCGQGRRNKSHSIESTSATATVLQFNEINYIIIALGAKAFLTEQVKERYSNN